MSYSMSEYQADKNFLVTILSLHYRLHSIRYYPLCSICRFYKRYIIYKLDCIGHLRKYRFSLRGNIVSHKGDLIVTY